MPAKKPWTLASIERACRKVFVERTRLKLRGVPGCASAMASWVGDGTVTLTIDNFQVSQISGVIHELLHVVLEEEMEPFEEYGAKMKREPAELSIDAWETALVNEILASPRRKAWWRRAIRGKLPKHR